MGLGADDEKFLRDVIKSCKPDLPLEYGDDRYVPFDSIPGDGEYSVRGIDLPMRMAAHVQTADEVTTQLLAGFRGAGKSTELRRLKRLLEERGYDVILKDADTFLNLTTPAEIGDIMLALAAALEEGVTALAPDAPPRLDWFERVRGYFRKRSFEPTELDVGVDAKVFKATLKGSLKQDPMFRKKLQEHLSGLTYEFHQEFRGYLTELLAWFRDNRAQRKGVVFIFDGVDHIRGSFGLRDDVQHSVETLFSQFSDMLKLPGLHAVYTVPTYLPFLNPGLRGLYGMASLQVLPMTKQHRPEPERGPDEKGVAALRDFVQRRIGEPERLLGVSWEGALDEMIAASGGYLRDLLAMVRSATETAFVAGGLPAPATATRRAIQELTNDYRRAVTPEDAVVLSRIAESFSIDHVPTDYRLRLADLFETHVTMCYCSGEEWYDVHPLALDRVTQIPA